MMALTDIVLFLVAIIALVLVHEFGHFVVAKLSRMRVEEFGFGFPPRALTIAKVDGTEYTLNWLPIGGFVRIYGEDGIPAETGKAEEGNTLETASAATPSQDSFVAKPRILQALVLVAGVAMNIVFAYILLSVTLGLGTLQQLTQAQLTTTKDATIVFASVLPNSPAAKAGRMAGDEVKSAMIRNGFIGLGYSGNNPLGLATLIANDTNRSPMIFTVDRNGQQLTLTATPVEGMIPSDPSRPGLGVSISAIGTVKTPWVQAPIQGLSYTWNIMEQVAIGLFNFFKNIVVLKPDFSQVSGPIGIARYLGQASTQGLSAVLTTIALISINLAFVNFIPIPALDGGRLLFVVIEAFRRKPIPARIAERVNTFFFVLLILLILAVSAHDIITWIQ